MMEEKRLAVSRIPYTRGARAGVRVSHRRPPSGVGGERPIAMPIRPFLNGEEFDAETLRILGVAFEQTCIALRIENSADDVRQAIANKIIEIAKTGERTPDRLCEGALKEIRQPRI
jgi:hypothetical protein